MAHRVCHITTAHIAEDIRIFHKECKTLSQNGYEVYLVANYERETIKDGVHIVPLPQNNNRFYRFLIKPFTAMRIALKTKSSVYHFHDPELILIGRILSLLGKKVIYDVHEDYAKSVMTREWVKPYLKKIISKTFNRFEKNSVKYFSRVISARPDISENFPKDKTTTVRNMAILKLIDEVKPADIKKDKMVVIYAGGINKIRGIKEIIEAIGLLKGEAEFWLLGKWDSQSFKDECEKLEGWKYTKDFGFLDLETAYSYMKRADIGIVNFLPAPNHNTTQPNKPFEYMTCSLPMVMSDFEYWQKLFNGCTLFVNPMDPLDISKKIKMLLDDKNLRAELGKKGRVYVEENYSWEAESKVLLKVYEEILNK
ncbi:Glycosyltransferase involved in cell wall bisynthesis [Caloramator quimbayensis]|uniref:Glycosyltransferase involved in cell wall bisynthesis n=1 Tax=Caloramator quimbayensis TaxID=1147123 RepID=A0A1T4Y573_9CLOT|nr:glycosyltransferase family 4 protein [Caloramator quimbayensis]SKA96471.1 Glycosyltransferase involved in cell wall bisynthesis [Caloramator quimbayensis]